MAMPEHWIDRALLVQDEEQQKRGGGYRVDMIHSNSRKVTLKVTAPGISTSRYKELVTRSLTPGSQGRRGK